MGVQSTTALTVGERPTVYLVIVLPRRLLVMTVEEFMEFPRSMYTGWSCINMIVGEGALLDHLKESGRV